MKRDNAPAGAGIALLVFTIPALLSCTSTRQSASANVHPQSAVESESKAAGALPPLVVDTRAPLLLDEADERQKATTVAATRAAAENSACLVCHANFKTEFLVRRHAAADIGCFHCHGRSLAHQNDENNTTAPQIMYAADQIDPFCRSCHKTHDVPAREVVARWVERGLDKTDSKSIVCTDCHGQHRMKVRTVIWDKKSGKLLRTNRGD